MKKVLTILALAALIITQHSCSVSKFIPSGEHLLDKVKIKSDNPAVDTEEYLTYIRQTPNSRWFSMFKIPMHIYTLTGTDSTKTINKFLRRVGEEPRLYSRAAALKTKTEICKAVRNKGYIRAEVELDEKQEGKKINLTYKIHTGLPYTINKITHDIYDPDIREIIHSASSASKLRQGMRLDIEKLEEERIRLTRTIQDSGYFRFNKDFLIYTADTIENTYTADLTLHLRHYRQKAGDKPRDHYRYTIDTVTIIVNNHMTGIRTWRKETNDSLTRDNLNIYYKTKPFLRPDVITDNTRLRPGDWYSRKKVNTTRALFGGLKALRYSNIYFTEDEARHRLNAYLALSGGKTKSLQFGLEGTNTAGDLGMGASAAIQNRNLFHGSEALTIKLRGSYEAITAPGTQDFVNDSYREFGAEASLNFPKFMIPFLSETFKKRVRASSELGLRYTWQLRPEFSRTLFSASWSYKWNDNKQRHKYDLVDINYGYMRRKSKTFEDYLAKLSARNSLLKASYEDQLIVRMAYTYTYNSSGNIQMRTPDHDAYSLRISIEEAGNTLYAFSKAFHKKTKPGRESYVMADMPFAQYIKFDIDYTRNIQIDRRNALVCHLGLGVACPYLNSHILPFEKRYFSGGANSVRGWTVRGLGPGAHQTNEDTMMDFIKQSGDIKLDLNLEYRTRLFWKLRGALFLDAGNIWTMRSDVEQTDGQFKFNKFYKQLAVAYGLGLRLDLDYLILRFDGGLKAINPMKRGRSQYPILHQNFTRDFAFHFAVGYPF